MWILCKLIQNAHIALLILLCAFAAEGAEHSNSPGNAACPGGLGGVYRTLQKLDDEPEFPGIPLVRHYFGENVEPGTVVDLVFERNSYFRTFIPKTFRGTYIGFDNENDSFVFKDSKGKIRTFPRLGLESLTAPLLHSQASSEEAAEWPPPVVYYYSFTNSWGTPYKRFYRERGGGLYRGREDSYASRFLKDESTLDNALATADTPAKKRRLMIALGIQRGTWPCRSDLTGAMRTVASRTALDQENNILVVCRAFYYAAKYMPDLTAGYFEYLTFGMRLLDLAVKNAAKDQAKAQVLIKEAVFLIDRGLAGNHGVFQWEKSKSLDDDGKFRLLTTEYGRSKNPRVREIVHEIVYGKPEVPGDPKIPLRIHDAVKSSNLRIREVGDDDTSTEDTASENEDLEARQKKAHLGR